MSKVYCKGMLCRLSDRRNTKCSVCHKYICNICQIKDFEDGNLKCSECFVNEFELDWDKVNNAFENDLNKLKMSLGYKPKVKLKRGVDYGKEKTISWSP